MKTRFGFWDEDTFDAKVNEMWIDKLDPEQLKEEIRTLRNKFFWFRFCIGILIAVVVFGGALVLIDVVGRDISTRQNQEMMYEKLLFTAGKEICKNNKDQVKVVDHTLDSVYVYCENKTIIANWNEPVTLPPR